MPITRIEPYIVNSSANFTFAGVNATGNLSVAGVSNLGPVGNLIITGGSNGQVLTTNGSGNLSWTTISGGGGGNSISNGNSNVSIATANGNITMSAVGNANIVVVTGTGVNVAGTLNVTGNANAGNIGATGGVFTTVAGTLTTAAQPNITSVGTLTSLTATGNITAGNANLGNAVTANFFIGNGSLLTGITAVSAAGIANGNSNIAIPAANGNVNISAAGNANILVVTGTGTNVAGTLNVTGNANAGNIGATGGVFTTVAGALTTAAQPNITSVGTLSSLAVTANITAGNANLGNNVSANFFTGNGVYLTGITTAGISNGNSNVSIPAANGNINFSASGNANVVVITGTGINVAGAGNVTGANLITANTGNFSAGLITGGNLSVSGNAVVSGNLTVNGNLSYINVTDLAVSDPIIQLQTGANGAAPTSNSGKDVGTALNYYDTAARVAFMGWDVSNAEIAFGSNVSIASEVVTFNTLANIRSGNAQLGNLAAANFFSGTLTTAAQPNITSIGTLSSLAATGNITAGNMYANSGTIGAGSLTGTLTTAAQPNITSLGTLSSLTATGNITAANFVGSLANGNSTISIPAANGNINLNAGGTATPELVITPTGANITGTFQVTGVSNLGPVGNVIITGGSNGQVLTTNGSGGLSWTTVSGGGGGGANIANGNSNVNIATANGNVTVSVAGNANVVTFTGTGANIAGTLQVSGVSNLGPVGNVRITGGNTNQVLTTDGAGNLSWTNSTQVTAFSDTFTGNGVQTTFTLSTTPANINLTYVNYNGALMQRSSYSLSGANLVLSSAPANGSTIEVTTMSGFTTQGVAYSRTNATATASQTTFNVVYAPGYLQVYYNGVLLAPSDYTATNGTTVVLADPATAGDLVEFVAFTTATTSVAQPATLNSTTLNSNLAITAGYSAVSVGPISIANGVSVTIADGQKWVIL